MVIRWMQCAVIVLLCASLGWAADPPPVTKAAQPWVQRVEAGAPDAAGEPYAFEIVVETPPEAMARAFLVYELAGVPHWTAAVRSINGLPPRGGFGAVVSSGVTVQVEEINPRWLRPGVNQIVFLPSPAADAVAPLRVTALHARLDGRLPYTVRNLRLIHIEGPVEPRPRLQLSHPVSGESDERGAIVSGFADPPGIANVPAELFVNESYLPNGISLADGSFSVFVPRTTPAGEPWEARIEVVYPDGTRLRKTVAFSGAKPGDGSDDDSAELDADGGSDDSLTLDDATLEVKPGALRGKVKLTVRGLASEELPALDAGMTNVTPRRRGFRLGPHGLRFAKAVHLRLPYDPDLLPNGMTADDIRTFYFDEASGRWFPLARAETEGADLEVKGPAGRHAIVSVTDHFTDFINATLALPDDPGGAGHSPNSLEELAKADPASQIVEIAPPEGDATGDAAVSFPIVIPPGRLGMQPTLAVQYNSAAGNGWLGVGWSLELPSVEISTEFGVPAYDGAERYVLAGDQLTLAAGVTPSSETPFVRRIEGSFDRIVRKESSPSTFWWEVTDKNGTRFIYGRSAQARLKDPFSGNIFRWLLEQEIDLHGNTVDYFYFTDSGGRGLFDGDPWSQIYPDHIDYTGVNGAGAHYRVQFHRDAADSRPDRISSGLAGFKTYTRHRLASIEVRARQTVVRRYDFAYTQGDFAKTLLESIAVTGEGGAQEFYRHNFSYSRMATEADGYAGFAAMETWSGMGASSDFTAGTRAGGGAHGFVGLGPIPICQPHVGVQFGGNATNSSQSVAFLDVNGDGLPDRLHQNGTLDLNRFSPLNGSTTGSFMRSTFTGADTLSRTSEWGLDVSVGVHAEAGLNGSLDSSFAWTFANDDHMVADIDGDLRPDLISTDNGFRVRRNTGTSFTSGAWTGFSGDGLQLAAGNPEGDVLSKFRLADPLRALELPYSGRVAIGGAIQKKENSGDGVAVKIYRNAILVWSRVIAGSSTAPCTPGPNHSCGGGLTIDVAAGDDLYFFANSIRDTSGDELLWAPVVTYEDRSAEAREPHGAREFVFDAAEDFTLAGYDGAAWVAGATGQVRITGALTKQQTSDDVQVRILRRPNLVDQLGIPIEIPFYERTFPAAEETSFSDFPPFTVASGDLVFIRLISNTPIDPRKIQWTPSIEFVGQTNPPDLPEELKSGTAQVAMNVTNWSGTAPLETWTPPAAGEQTFKVSCNLTSPATLYVQRVNRLVSRRDVASGTSEVELKFSTDTTEPLFVTFFGPNSLINGDCSVNGGAVPVNFRWKNLRGETLNLSGGYHGWRYGEWNGNIPLLLEAMLAPPVPPEDEDDPPPDPAAIPGAPRWEGSEDVDRPIWLATGFDFHISATTVKPSRRGGNAAGILDSASGAASGLSILRKTDGQTIGVDASIDIISGLGGGLGLSWGKSDTTLDLLDMNGDGYPDQVSGSGVRFSNGRSSFGALRPFPGLAEFVRRTEDGNVSTSAGLGISFTRRKGDGSVSSISAPVPNVGNTISLSHTMSDLVDVNGDGLPDRVVMTPGAASMTVLLNLGNRFSEAELWDLPPLSEANRCNDVVDYVSSNLAEMVHLDSMSGLSFTRSSGLSAGLAIGPFGGGVSTTLSRTLVELIDVNGDGLPDRVAKDHNDPYFRVQINLGDRWDHERRWYAPNWPVSIGDGYNPGGAFQCLDAVSFNGNIEVTGSAGAPICIPLLVIGIQIELSAQGFGSLGEGMQLAMEDLDGDGLTDHILKKKNDANVYVRRNQAGGVNLLRSIERPLGSTIVISYQRRGNTVNNPHSQWALAKVAVKDGHSGVTAETSYDYPNDVLYDREERESYGYGSVGITLPDGSKIERTFENRDFYKRHLQTKEVFKDRDGKLFEVRTSRYDETEVATFSRFNAPVESRTDHYEGLSTVEGGTSKSRTETFAYDSRGNIVTNHDSGDSGDDDNVSAAVTYQFDAATNLTRASTIEVRDGAGRLLRRRHGTYDAAGDLTRLEQTLTGGRDPDTGGTYGGTKNPVWTFTYDALGNRTSTTDANGVVSTVTYEQTAHIYPQSVTDSLGYTTGYAYDLKHGELAAATDQNGNTIARAFDAFGRLLRVVGPYDTDAAPGLSFEYGRSGAVSWAVVHHKDATRSSDPIDSATFIDSLGRVLQTKEEAELDLGNGTATRAGLRVSGLVAFDILGRVISQGQPVFDTNPVNQFVRVASKKPTTFTYDALGRVRTVKFPHDNAVTRLDYDFAAFDNTTRFRTTRTDPKGRVTRFYRDLADNVIAIQQTTSGGQKTLTTRYAYDALDQLRQVTDARGNPTTLEYDTLGRRTLVDNRDLGRTEFRYDPAGSLRAKITANLAAANQQIRYHYSHGRLDRIDYPQSPDVTYTYGAPGASANRANRIATITDASGIEELAYGKLGEVVQSVKSARTLKDGTLTGPHRTQFTFDGFGRMLSITYPDGDTVTYGYDAGGKVKSATGTLMGARFEHLRHIGYDELGDRVRIVYGNGVETRFTRDPSSRFLTGLDTALANRPLQNLRYTYDSTGTMLSLQNNAPAANRSGSVTESFQYDDLVQLTGAQGTYNASGGPNKTSTYALTLAYDDLGNLTAKNQLHQTGNGNKLAPEKKTTYAAAYAYGSTRPHAPTTIGDRTFTYDANGNQTGWTSTATNTIRALTWDEENRLTAVTDNGRATRFLYDAHGVRTNKVGQHGESMYVNRWFTLRNGTSASKHVYADDLRIATKVTPDPAPPYEKVYFFTADHLGSANFITDEAGLLYQHLEYFPTGEIWVDDRSDTQKTPQLFSGKELDEETGLSYFGARYYDARQGQWISADPILDELLAVASLPAANETRTAFFLPGHLYGYVANNPTNLTDPEGLAKKKTPGDVIHKNKKAGDAAADYLATQIHAGSSAKREKLFKTSKGIRRVDVFVGYDRSANESKVGRIGATAFIKKEIAKDVELMTSKKKFRVRTVRWYFFKSKTTRKVGPTPELLLLLTNAGIDVIIDKNKSF